MKLNIELYGGRGASSSKNKFKLEKGYKQVRVNKQFGEWGYNKEIDPEDSKNYMYNFYGIDKSGKEWDWNTPFYNEMIEFIKGDNELKRNFIRTR